MFKEKCQRDRKNAGIGKNDDVIEIFFIGLKNKIVVLYFERFWAYRSFQGRFQMGGIGLRLLDTISFLKHKIEFKGKMSLVLVF